ncbi:MAG: glycerophosphodiester phosphodiesterase family protein [Planctomycetota bacterium]
MESGSASIGAIARRASELLRASLTDVVLYGVAYRLAVFAVLSPIVAFIARGLFAASGRTAVANADLLSFALSPIGAVSVVVLGSIAATLSIAGHSGVSALAVSRARGKALHWWDSLALVAKRWRDVLRLSASIVLRCLAFALPFVLALGLVYRGFLGEHDINYYLTEKPPELWKALASAAAIVVLLVFVVGERLVSWSLSLPFVLLDRLAPGEALARSRRIVAKGGRMRAIAVIAGGPILAAIAGGLFGGVVNFATGLALDAVEDNLRVTAAVLGLSALLQTIATVVLSIAGVSAAVYAAIAYLEAVEPESLPEAPDAAVAQTDNRWLRSPRTIAFGLLGAAALALVVAGSLVSGIDAPDDVRIVAHRAGGLLGPENTLEALEASIEAAADVAEIDVQRSADGVVVVVHDSDLMKRAGLPWKVAETDADALCKPRDEGGAGLSTLVEFCEAARGKIPLCVELKYYGGDEELVPATLAILEEEGVLETSEIISLEAKALEQVRRVAPDVRTGFLSSVKLGPLTRLDVDFLAVADKSATTALVRDARNRDMEVYSWTLNDRDAISDAIDRGVIGIITDDPVMAHEVLQSRAELTDVERLLLRFGAVR